MDSHKLDQSYDQSYTRVTDSPELDQSYDQSYTRVNQSYDQS